MDYKDYYKTLGVAKGASQDEMKKAYRKLAGKYHPDVNQGDKKAEQRFKEIQEAYEVLKDPEKRKLYDRVGTNWKQYQRAGGNADNFDWSQFMGQQGRPRYTSQEDFNDFFGGGFSDFFETLFGRFSGGGSGSRRSPFGSAFNTGTSSKRAVRNGKDLEANLEITLQEAFSGSTRSFTVNSEQVRVKIPAGISEGKSLKLKGKGQHGGGSVPRGDLYLRIKIKNDDRFERRGDDLYTDVDVDLYTMILGGAVHVPTFTGSIKLNVPAGTENDKLMRLKGQGMPNLGQTSTRGDLYVRLKVKLPSRLTNSEKELFKELADKRTG